MGKSKCLYEYGMRLRGYSPGAQPKKGLVYVKDDTTGKYWSVLAYDRKLTDEEVESYELVFLQALVDLTDTK